MIKVPAQYQVRIIKPRSEDAVPHFVVKDIIEIEEDRFTLMVKKALSGGVIGAVLGFGLFGAIQFCGINFGGLETSIILGIPLCLGLLASYVIS